LACFTLSSRRRRLRAASPGATLSDPLALLPFACAARGGRVGDAAAVDLVAAGTTLLVRSAPLVRALAGRRAGILLPPGEGFLTALAASEGRGAVLINPLAAPLEIAYQLADADVGAVFTTSALAGRMPEGVVHVLLDDAPRSARVSAGGSVRDIDLGSHVGLQLEGDPDAPGREEEAAIVYTSAMAGRPLGAILTHRALLHNARATLDATGMTSSDRVLAVLPHAHLFGFTATLVSPLLAGAAVLPVARFHPAQMAQRLVEGDATILVGVPAVYVALLNALETLDQPTLTGLLRLCICGGAPLDAALQERWEERTGIALRQGYGLTEAGPVALFDGPPSPGRPGVLGVPLPGVSVSIRDPETSAPLERGVVGEICIAGESLFSGYVGGAATGLAVRDGWLHSGDLGTMDGDGAVTFGGVRKAMFTRNGFNIYPREIESAVMELPGVESATVEAVPSEAHGNDIRLTVLGVVAEPEIAAWCTRRLSAYKQPTAISVRPGRSA
jgi:long-chain acyl-CoA synthetase